MERNELWRCDTEKYDIYVYFIAKCSVWVKSINTYGVALKIAASDETAS